MKSIKTKPKKSRGHDGRKANPNQANQATSIDFEREGMGVAPKE